MMKFNIIYLYPNVMDLYGDNGNLEILKYRLNKRGIEVNIDTYTIGDANLELGEYDLVFMGGGSDKEQKLVAKDLIKYKEKIKRSINSGTFYLLICGAYQLFGKYYKDSENNKIEGLNIFDYYTSSSTDKKERCIGDIIVESEITGTKTKIVGFENHGGQTENVVYPFGRVLYGNGNKFNSKYEGFYNGNVLGTYLHGPLLSKNPELADFIITKCLEKKYNKKIKLKELNDSFEINAKNEILEKYNKQIYSS